MSVSIARAHFTDSDGCEFFGRRDRDRRVSRVRHGRGKNDSWNESAADDIIRSTLSETSSVEQYVCTLFSKPRLYESISLAVVVFSQRAMGLPYAAPFYEFYETCAPN